MGYSRKPNLGEINRTRELIQKHNEFVSFDIETTGLSAKNGDRIIEIGAVKIKNGKVIDVFHSLINPGIRLPYRTTELTGITDSDVEDSPSFEEVLSEFKTFAGELVLVAHNAKFDLSFIQHYGAFIDIEFNQPSIDTVQMSRFLLTNLQSHKLNLVADSLKIRQNSHHRADDDARVCGEIFIKLAKMLKGEGNSENKDIASDLKIKKISYWEKGELKRIYVNGISFTAFFDINKMEWVDKSNSLNIEALHQKVCTMIGVKSYDEIAKFKGVVSA
ncbi:MAG: exonuclease domain-containing protein [Bacillota bacterium]|nr:exonuclease domain-containing protein [Bacillota bacterium]